MGLSVADHLTSCHLAQGVTALLFRRERTGRGGLVQTSLLESMLDLQFELLSTHLNDSSVTVRRGGPHAAHAFLPAPYGTYRTADGYLALAMNPVPRLGRLLGLPELEAYQDEQQWWDHADEIADRLSTRLSTRRHRRTGWRSSTPPTCGAPRCSPSSSSSPVRGSRRSG